VLKFCKNIISMESGSSLTFIKIRYQVENALFCDDLAWIDSFVVCTGQFSTSYIVVDLYSGDTCYKSRWMQQLSWQIFHSFLLFNRNTVFSLWSRSQSVVTVYIGWEVHVNKLRGTEGLKSTLECGVKGFKSYSMLQLRNIDYNIHRLPIT
jgi:hypothetical protein